MKVDLHTHILPERWPDLAERFGYPGWLRLEHCAPCRAKLLIGDRAFREIESNCWDPQRRLAECDVAGVAIQVLSTVPVMFSYWARPEDTLDLARRLNDHIAGIVRDHPQRFRGLGTVPMQSPDLAIRELERCVQPPSRGGLGLSGVEIGTHVDANLFTGNSVWNLNDPGVFDVLSAAAELGAAVFVHPWDMLGKDRLPKYWLPWLVGMPAETCAAICCVLFGGVLERLPTLRICFAHGGGSFAGTLGRIEHGFRARPDLVATDNPHPPRTYLADPQTGRVARFYVDSLVHDADTLRRLIDIMGPQRIALGTDYPFPLGEATPGALIESLDLPSSVKEQLLRRTAMEFLGAA